MNTAKILKRAPIAIMVVCLAYACFTIHAAVPDSGSGRNELAKGLDLMVSDVLKAGADDVRSLTRVALRDPFRITRIASAEQKEAAVTAADPETDPLLEVVRRLSLDATFVQGKTQIAIISGRMYHQGEHLRVQGDDGKPFSPLYVQNVQAHRVMLMAHTRGYELGYPEHLGKKPPDRGPDAKSPVDGSVAEIDPEGELAFYKRLLKSPLGKLGKSITGNLGPSDGASRGGKPNGSNRSRGLASSGAP
jgi:hypothetical protein